MPPTKTQVTVVGLGYVGLPLAIALAKQFQTIGMDIDAHRITELKSGYDRTNEIDPERLRESSLRLEEAHASDCPPSDFYIVTVPTPIDRHNRPDLTILGAASHSVGRLVAHSHVAGRQPIVVFESTVYPGVTEEFCAPILEEASGLQCGRDFFLGYSPERINPGDREHTIDKITKVVSGQTPEVLARIADLYAAITSGGVYLASSIKAAEAAKVIENAQRDINIAFMNEIAQIFGRMDLSVWDVLAAARTKWNFLPFTPGLVGGHCIGVDPYYLATRATELGHDPKVILAGRGVNDAMAGWVADRLHTAREGKAGSVLVLGLSFKEDVPDLRNSKVADLIAALSALNHDVTVHDPHADPAEARSEYAIELAPHALDRQYDLVVLAVPHRTYLEKGPGFFRRLVVPSGTLADLKGALDSGVADWTL